jgi:hypothetical protein
MASGKRQPSKQKRSKQNRQATAARQARAAAANRAASAQTSKAKAPAKTSLLGRMRSAAGGTAPNRATRAERMAERDAERAASVEPELDEDQYDEEPYDEQPYDDEVDDDVEEVDDEPTEPAGPKTLLGRLRTSETALPSRAAREPRPVAAAAQRGVTKAVDKRAAATSRTTPRSSGRTTAGKRAAAPVRNPNAQPVGYRAALTGALAGVAAVVASFLVHAPVDAGGELYTKPSIVAEWSQSALHAAGDAPTAEPATIAASVDDWMPGRGSDRLFLIYWPTSLAVLLPVGASILAFRAVRDRRPSKIVTRAMYATLLGSILTVGLLQFFIPTVIAISVASFQVRKAEMAAIRAAQADGVIEAELVDDDEDR